MCLCFAPPLVAQEPERPAAAPPDSAVGRLPGELTGTLADSAAQREFAHLVEELGPPSGGWSWSAYEWDRDAILRSNALTLLDLLSEIVPGFTPLRATWFGGPHQIAQGVLGPAFVDLSVDGREVTTLDAGQVDFSRIALASVERVRVRRRADGWVAEVTTLRRDRRAAYSRITGGTGDPSLSRLRLVFSNGMGESLNLNTSVDLLDTGGDYPSRDFNFWGRVEWIPGGGDAGLEVHWLTENMERTVYGPDSFDRREIFVRGRGDLGEHLQTEAFVGRTSLSREDESVRDVTHGGFRLSGSTGNGWFRSTFQMWDDPLYARVDGGVEAGYRVLPWLSVDAGGRLGSWEDFSAREARAGFSVRLQPLDLTLTAEGATGTKGVSYPTLERADSVSFDAAAGEVGLRIGPFTLTGRGEYQSLSRQLPFGAEFDRAMPPGPAIDLGIAEGGLTGPLVPLDVLLGDVAPIAVRGFWRHATVIDGAEPLYVPPNVARGEIYWNDTFFDGNLEFNASFGLNYRDSMIMPASPDAGTGVTTRVDGYRFADWNLMIRVLSVRVYYRFDNLSGSQAEDVPGLLFAPRRSVFGVKWEFLN